MNKSISSQLFLFPVLNSKYYLLLFILWPFLAFLTALINYSQKEARKVVYFFLIYYGFSFINSNEGVDAFRYALSLKFNALLPFSDFFKIVNGIYSTDTTIDIVEPLISFLVSRFTSHYSLYFAVWAALFGLFYLKSINLLHDRYKENPGWNALIIIAFFTVIIPITTINGVRMYTAAWIFFYGAYHVVLNRDPRYLLLAIGSSLVHFSFLSANAILILYFFIGNRNFIYLPIAVLSFILPYLISPLFQLISLKLGGVFQQRYEGYSNEDYIIAMQDMHEQSTWFLKIGDDLVFYYLLLTIFVIQIMHRSLMKEKEVKNLFSFLLLFLSFVNFGKAIPALGGRFRTIFYLFAVLYVFHYFVKLPGNKINLLIFIGLLPMLLYAAIQFRMGSESINAWIFTPGLGFPLLVPGLSIADFLFN